MAPDKKLNIFDFTDYHNFLYTWYILKKTDNPKFSYRMIASRVGFKSPGLFTQLCQGKVRISIKLALQFADYMNLNQRESDYFLTLIKFCHAENEDEKQIFFKELTLFRESVVYKIPLEKYEYYQCWYYGAIRSLLAYYNFTDDFEELGKLLIPNIDELQAKQAINLLVRLEMVQVDSNGFLRPTDRFISSGFENRHHALDQCIYQSLDRARDAVGIFTKKDRNISRMTLGISKQAFEEIQSELRQFRRRITDIACKYDADRVYQLSIQLFPLSKKIEQNSKLVSGSKKKINKELNPKMQDLQVRK